MNQDSLNYALIVNSMKVSGHETAGLIRVQGKSHGGLAIALTRWQWLHVEIHTCA